MKGLLTSTVFAGATLPSRSTGVAQPLNHVLSDLRMATHRRAGLPAGAISIPSHALIYLSVPKAAGTTIKNLLYFAEYGRYTDEPLGIHSHDGLLRSRNASREVAAQFRQKLERPHLVFTFVRHPGRRAYSCFGEKVFHRSKHSFPEVQDLMVARYGLALPADDHTDYDVQRHRRNFLCYLDFLADNFAGRIDLRTRLAARLGPRKNAHWDRQTHILEQFQRLFVIDFTGRVEDFGRQFRFVMDQFSLKHRPDPDLRFNEGPRPPFSYEEVVDAEVEARLRKLYAPDYERLGYASEPDRTGG